MTTSYLSNEEMVEVGLQGLLVHIEDLVAKMQRIGAIAPLDDACVGLLDRMALLVKALPPPDCVLHLQLQPGPPLLVLLCRLIVHFILVGLAVKGPGLDRKEVRQLHKVNFLSQVCLDFRYL